VGHRLDDMQKYM